MLTIYVISDLYNGYSTVFLDTIVILSIISGIFIIITKNPIVSVLFLILLFSSISCYLIFIGMKFIGLSYLLVYVGAVSILFIFILMLINIRVSELISDTNNNIPLAILAIIAVFIPFNNLLPYNKNDFNMFGLDLLQLIDKTIDYKQISYVSSNN
jgi:NADH-ubiquinone oxidoreductase chain 6